MIFGENIATIETNGFQPQTMLSVQTHEGKMLKIHEVSGFNEKPLSTKDLIQIVEDLKYLIELISTSRIHLIVLVSRAERISKTLEQNYEMFVKILAKKEVKILMVRYAIIIFLIIIFIISANILVLYEGREYMRGQNHVW